MSVRCSLLNRTPEPLESVVILAGSDDYSFIEVQNWTVAYDEVTCAPNPAYPFVLHRLSRMDTSRVESLVLTDLGFKRQVKVGFYSSKLILKSGLEFRPSVN